MWLWYSYCIPLFCEEERVQLRVVMNGSALRQYVARHGTFKILKTNQQLLLIGKPTVQRDLDNGAVCYYQ